MGNRPSISDSKQLFTACKQVIKNNKMSKTRTKKKVYSNVTTEQAQTASEQYAVVKNKLALIQAKMNEELNKVKSKYADQVSELDEQLEEPENILHSYASEQKSSWGKRKSLELLHTTIGFRTGTPKVSKDKKFTWDAVLELVNKNKVFKHFVRKKEELNKESILAEKNEDVLKQLKDECYVYIEQDETFFVEAKVEAVASV